MDRSRIGVRVPILWQVHHQVAVQCPASKAKDLQLLVLVLKERLDLDLGPDLPIHLLTT